MERKKTGGRKKGVPNKIPGELRERLVASLKERLPRLLEEMDKLEGEQFVKAFAIYARFCIPQPQAINVEGSLTQRRITIEERLIALCQTKDK